MKLSLPFQSIPKKPRKVSRFVYICIYFNFSFFQFALDLFSFRETNFFSLPENEISLFQSPLCTLMVSSVSVVFLVHCHHRAHQPTVHTAPISTKPLLSVVPVTIQLLPPSSFKQALNEFFRSPFKVCGSNLSITNFDRTNIPSAFPYYIKTKKYIGKLGEELYKTRSHEYF